MARTKQYSATTAKQSRFKEAALLAQETAAAEEEGESQAMLFAMLQEQHDKHRSDDSNKQGQHGRDDGTDECNGNWTRRRQAQSTKPATGQGKHTSRQHQPKQTSQEEDSSMSTLQKMGPPQI